MPLGRYSDDDTSPPSAVAVLLSCFSFSHPSDDRRPQSLVYLPLSLPAALHFCVPFVRNSACHCITSSSEKKESAVVLHQIKNRNALNIVHTSWQLILPHNRPKLPNQDVSFILPFSLIQYTICSSPMSYSNIYTRFHAHLFFYTFQYPHKVQIMRDARCHVTVANLNGENVFFFDSFSTVQIGRTFFG